MMSENWFTKNRSTIRQVIAQAERVKAAEKLAKEKEKPKKKESKPRSIKERAAIVIDKGPDKWLTGTLSNLLAENPNILRIRRGEEEIPLRPDPLRRPEKPKPELEPQVSDAPRVAPVLTYFDPNAKGDYQAQANDAQRRMDLQDRQALFAGNNRRMKIDRNYRLDPRAQELVRDNPHISDKFYEDDDFAELFVGNSAFRDHFGGLDIDKYATPDREKSVTSRSTKKYTNPITGMMTPSEWGEYYKHKVAIMISQADSLQDRIDSMPDGDPLKNKLIAQILDMADDIEKIIDNDGDIAKSYGIDWEDNVNDYTKQYPVIPWETERGITLKGDESFLRDPEKFDVYYKLMGKLLQDGDRLGFDDQPVQRDRDIEDLIKAVDFKGKNAEELTDLFNAMDGAGMDYSDHDLFKSLMGSSVKPNELAQMDLRDDFYKNLFSDSRDKYFLNLRLADVEDESGHLMDALRYVKSLPEEVREALRDMGQFESKFNKGIGGTDTDGDNVARVFRAKVLGEKLEDEYFELDEDHQKEMEFTDDDYSYLNHEFMENFPELAGQRMDYFGRGLVAAHINNEGSVDLDDSDLQETGLEMYNLVNAVSGTIEEDLTDEDRESPEFFEQVRNLIDNELQGYDISDLYYSGEYYEGYPITDGHMGGFSYPDSSDSSLYTLGEWWDRIVSDVDEAGVERDSELRAENEDDDYEDDEDPRFTADLLWGESPEIEDMPKLDQLKRRGIEKAADKADRLANNAPPAVRNNDKAQQAYQAIQSKERETRPRGEGGPTGSSNKSYRDDLTNYSTTTYNNPNQFGTHRYETLDADLKRAGLKRTDLQQSMYIAWQASGNMKLDDIKAKYKKKTGKEAEGPEFDQYRRRITALNAVKNWKQNVLPDIKPGTILYNTPSHGGAGGNIREVLYSKMGFGAYGPYGQQAVVGKDGKVYPIGPRSEGSMKRRLDNRANARARRRPQNESMGEVMYWWQQFPSLTQEEIISVLADF